MRTDRELFSEAQSVSKEAARLFGDGDFKRAAAEFRLATGLLMRLAARHVRTPKGKN